MDNKKNIKKEVKIDIRKLPIRRGLGIPNIIAMVVISLALTGAIIFFRGLGTKGEEVSVSKIVTDISQENSDTTILKDGIVT